jgi:predicted porin
MGTSENQNADDNQKGTKKNEQPLASGDLSKKEGIDEGQNPPKHPKPLWTHTALPVKQSSTNTPTTQKKSNAQQDSPGDQKILGKILKQQEVGHAGGVVVPTGSALFNLRTVANQEADVDAPPVPNLDATTKTIKPVNKSATTPHMSPPSGPTRQPLPLVEQQPSEPSLLRVSEKLTPKKTENGVARVVATQVSNEDLQKQAIDYSSKFMRLDTTKLLEEGHAAPPPAAGNNPQDVKNQQCEVIECDIATNEKEEAPHNKTYYAIPASVIATSGSPQIKFSGSICSHVGTVMQNDARDGKNGDIHIGVGWADLSWEVSGAICGTFLSKYVANLQVVPGDVSITDHYVQTECRYGTIQCGNLKGPDGTYPDDATGLVGGTGGVDGSMGGLISRPSGLPQTHHPTGYSKRATKIVYHSPRLCGFQVGIGYCPNPKHQGWGDLGEQNYSNSNDNGIEPTHKKRHNVTVGVNYAQEAKNVEVTASFVAIKEQASQIVEIPENIEAESKFSVNGTTVFAREFKLKGDTSIHTTGAIKYKNLKFACGYINNGKHSIPQSKENADATQRFGSHLGDAGRVWNIGGKYSVGCVDIGYARHQLKRQVTNTETSRGVIHSLSVDINIVSGVQVFAEINRVNQQTGETASTYDENANPLNNKGTVVLIGSKLSF